jgi:hypothetical protein
MEISFVAIGLPVKSDREDESIPIRDSSSYLLNQFNFCGTKPLNPLPFKYDDNPIFDANSTDWRIEAISLSTNMVLSELEQSREDSSCGVASPRRLRTAALFG